MVAPGPWKSRPANMSAPTRDSLAGESLSSLKTRCAAANVPTTGTKEKLIGFLLNPSAHQKKKGGESKRKAEPLWRVGDLIQARFDRDAIFYPGTITKVHSNGTYDILYDDGDVTRRRRPGAGAGGVTE